MISCLWGQRLFKKGMRKIKDKVEKYIKKFICANKKANSLIWITIIISIVGKLFFKMKLFEIILEGILYLTLFGFLVSSLIFIVGEFENNKKQIFVNWVYFILSALVSLI